MKHLFGFALVGLVVAAASGCVAPVGVGGLIRVPSDSAATCNTHCVGIGMGLDSVVIIANNVGCVCRSAAHPAVSVPGQLSELPPSNGGSTAAMAAVLEEESSRSNMRR